MYKIQTITAGSAVASLDFTVPSGYDDLMLVTSLRSARSAGFEEYRIYFNGANSNLSARNLGGDGASASSFAPAYGYIGVGNSSTSTSNTFTSQQIYISNYSSNTAKSYSVESVSEANATTAYSDIVAGLWNSTAAITSITLTNSTSSNWLQGSTATLYGIKSPKSFAKATGGTIYYDATNNKVYHVFTASGTFTPTQSISGVEYLVIGGGGGGGSYVGGGGGGAGGYRSSVVGELSGGNSSAESTLSLTAQAYTVTVGAGGAGQVGNTQSVKGSDSVFGSITAEGGGKGGGYVGSFYNGGNGGSGGGASYANSDPGTATANQGSNGGDGASDGGGGGGGAGETGSTSVFQKAGDGGDGISSSITGTAITRAGGGGGSWWTGNASGTQGFGGAGGGGNGALSGGDSAGSAGTVNTGSGGGGAVSTNVPATANGGNGGSGIVIVRYSA